MKNLIKLDCHVSICEVISCACCRLLSFHLPFLDLSIFDGMRQTNEGELLHVEILYTVAHTHVCIVYVSFIPASYYLLFLFASFKFPTAQNNYVLSSLTKPNVIYFIRV